MALKLLTVCGIATVRALAKHSPERIERLFFDAEHAPLFADTCRYLAQKRKTYRLVTPEELRKISDSQHHQGVAAVIHAHAPENISAFSAKGPALCLHEVNNPHNVGAIIRTAAFFGRDDIILSRSSYAAAMTASAWRVAEGGMTHCRLYAYDQPGDLFDHARRGKWFLAAAVRPAAKKTVLLDDLVEAKKEPLVVCVGNEETGLPDSFTDNCETVFSIPGNGRVESLNVSVAAAICLEKMATKMPAATRQLKA